jgi:hypothetical protein
MLNETGSLAPMMTSLAGSVEIIEPAGRVKLERFLLS